MTGPSLVILAAGRARRYGGLKQLAPIGVHGEGVIDLVASDAFAAGFEHIVVVVNPDTGGVIRDHVEEFWPEQAKVSFAVQDVARNRRRGARRREVSRHHRALRGIQCRRSLWS